MKRELTPENIQELKENQIFVFGSNMNGNHAGGAARLAVEKFGAIMGQAEGIQGQSYAIAGQGYAESYRRRTGRIFRELRELR